MPSGLSMTSVSNGVGERIAELVLPLGRYGTERKFGRSHELAAHRVALVGRHALEVPVERRLQILDEADLELEALVDSAVVVLAPQAKRRPGFDLRLSGTEHARLVGEREATIGRRGRSGHGEAGSGPKRSR